MKNKTRKISVTGETRRILKGYSPVSNAWYYSVLHDVITLIGVIKIRLRNIFRGEGL